MRSDTELMMGRDTFSLPKPGSLTAIICNTAADASAWVDHFALRFADQNRQRFAYFANLMSRRRRDLAERRARASQAEQIRALAWVDAWFTFNSPIQDPMLRNVEIGNVQGVVIDPFDPRRIEPGELGHVMDAVRSFAAGHQVHLWLVAPASGKVDLGKLNHVPERPRESRQSVGTLQRTQATEGLEFASAIQLPPVPIWTGNATVFRPSVAPPFP